MFRPVHRSREFREYKQPIREYEQPIGERISKAILDITNNYPPYGQTSKTKDTAINTIRSGNIFNGYNELWKTNTNKSGYIHNAPSSQLTIKSKSGNIIKVSSYRKKTYDKASAPKGGLDVVDINNAIIQHNRENSGSLTVFILCDSYYWDERNNLDDNKNIWGALIRKVGGDVRIPTLIKNKALVNCAIREFQEETGLTISQTLIDKINKTSVIPDSRRPIYYINIDLSDIEYEELVRPLKERTAKQQSEIVNVYYNKYLKYKNKYLELKKQIAK
jgi:hypothetical protein